MKLATMMIVIILSGLPLSRCGYKAPEPESTVAEAEGGQASKGVDYFKADPRLAASRTFMSEEEIDRLILADLESLTGEDRRSIRYLTLTHYHNAGLPDRALVPTRAGVAKFINSLSYAPDIVLPQPIDPNKTIFRINLRDYRLSRRTWSVIVRRYPYSVRFNTSEERQIRNLTGTNVPRVKADWFTSEAGGAGLYYFIMRINRNVRGLEFSLLGGSAEQNIRRRNVIRGATSRSGVSANNRMVERHAVGSSGRYYWKSYDFEAFNGRRQRNIFEFPLSSRNFRVQGFEAAGGEMIYSLPNGLQGYVLTDVNGNLLNEGPIEIVQDYERARTGNAVIINGAQCMGCHKSGMQQLNDEMQKHLQENEFAFNRFVLNTAGEIYPGPRALGDAYRRDANRFKAAMDKIGYSTDERFEPVVTLLNLYEGEMTKNQVAAELGLEPDDLIARLKRSRFLSRRFGKLINSGDVDRDVFERNFFNLVRFLGIGSGRILSGPYSEIPVTNNAQDQEPTEEELDQMDQQIMAAASTDQDEELVAEEEPE